MLVNERIKDYCRGEHLCKLNRTPVSEVYSLAGDRSRCSSRLKINCVKTVCSEPMNFSDSMGIVDCCMDCYGWRERGRLIFKHNFTESEGFVVYGRKNLSLRFQHLRYCASLSLPTRILNVLHQTLCFLVDFLFTLSGKLFCFQQVKVLLCKLFLSRRATLANEIVNTKLVHFPYLEMCKRAC